MTAAMHPFAATTAAIKVPPCRRRLFVFIVVVDGGDGRHQHAGRVAGQGVVQPFRLVQLIAGLPQPRRLLAGLDRRPPGTRRAAAGRPPLQPPVSRSAGAGAPRTGGSGDSAGQRREDVGQRADEREPVVVGRQLVELAQR